MDSILVVSSIFLWIFVLFNFILTIAFAQRLNNSLGIEERLKVGQNAPDFVAEDMDGQQITLSNFRDQVTLFIFISPHCSPCRAILPKLEGLKDSILNSNINVALVSDGEKSDLQIIIDQAKVFESVIYDREGNLQKKYKVSGTPFYCVIDQLGKVIETDFLDQELNVFHRLLVTNGREVHL
ncbi:MAG: hypothetical protein Fur0022_43480 [Anaerolineales bacterium]